MLVFDVLHAKGGPLVSAAVDTPLSKLLDIMIGAGIGSVIITDADATMVGIVTERSIVEAAAKRGPEVFSQAAYSLMRSPIPFCRPDDTVRHAMQLMTTLRTRHLLVASRDEVYGLVSIGDLVKFRIRDAELENSVLRDIASARILNG